MPRDVRRIVAYILYHGLAKRLPSSGWSLWPGRRLFRAFRGMLARQMLASAGKDINVEHGANFGGGTAIHLGDRSGLGLNSLVQSPTFLGNNVMMGPDVLILTNNHRFSRMDIPMMDQGRSQPKAVVIGDDVWIGARVIILPGSSVGRGAVIGAGAVVRGTIQDWSIVVGNPAQVIGVREDRS